MPTYRDYRRYGHGPITAGTLSIHPALWWGGAILIGVIAGVLI